MSELPLHNAIFEDLVVAVFKNNHRRRGFVPSNQNVIGGVNFERAMLHSGCSSLLLPIVDGILGLTRLKDMFPVQENEWTIHTGNGVAGQSVVLVIRRRDPLRDFDVQLGVNLGGGTMTIPYLRFYLCGEDLAYLSDHRNSRTPPNGYRDMFSAADREKLFLHRQNQSSRRFHALIGKSILTRHRSYDSVDYTYILAEGRHLSTTLLTSISNNATSLLLSATVENTQPTRFDDLEDEDYLDGAQFSDSGEDEGGDTGDEE